MQPPCSLVRSFAFDVDSSPRRATRRPARAGLRRPSASVLALAQLARRPSCHPPRCNGARCAGARFACSTPTAEPRPWPACALTGLDHLARPARRRPPLDYATDSEYRLGPAPLWRLLGSFSRR